jgi:hypothetical protein
MNLNSRIARMALTLALVAGIALTALPASAATTTSYYAWDNNGHSYVSTQSQVTATAAATAWNKSHSYKAVWSGFVEYGTCQPTIPATSRCPTATAATSIAGLLKAYAIGGDFWIATASSGAVFTSWVSQADASAKAAADLNPAPAQVYTAMSSAGVTYTSTISQAYANQMATFVEFTAQGAYWAPGVNGMYFASTISYADAVASAAAYRAENLYGASAGDYVGYDEAGTNPADVIYFLGPTQTAVDATAQAWGTALVRGGVWLATPTAGGWVYVSPASQAAATNLAHVHPTYCAWVDCVTAVSAAGITYTDVDGDQQVADNLASYTYHKTGPLPTSPEVCYQGSKSITISLFSFQCPAHWILLTPAKVSAAATKAYAAKLASVRTLYCNSPLGETTVTATHPTCPAGFVAKKNSLICTKGAIVVRLTGYAPKCPNGDATTRIPT